MKLFVLFALCAVAAAAPAEEVNYDDDVALDYHLSFGIPEAARILQYEQRLDFDGSRITGGDQVGPGAQPHLGGLDILMTGGFKSVCGCSLLTSTRAVTAAHCWRGLLGTQAQLFTVVYGSRFLYRGGVRVETADVEVHPNYRPYSLRNDIAIISHEKVTFNDYIRPINLPSGDELNDLFVDRVAYAAGYGRDGDDETNENPEKRQVALRVISNQECRRWSTGLGWRITASSICTSGNEGRSTCPGDSGGPLALSISEKRTILIGLTSFGTPSCTNGRPASYTRITSFVSWIQARI